MSITKYSGYTSVTHLTIGSKQELVYSSEMRNSSGELVDVIQKGEGSNLAKFNDVRALMFQKEAGFWVINHVVRTNEMQIFLVHDDSVTIAAVLPNCNNAISMCIVNSNQICIVQYFNQVKMGAIMGLVKDGNQYTLSHWDFCMLNLVCITDVTCTPNDKLVITQGYPFSCVKLIQDRKMQQVGRQSMFPAAQCSDGRADAVTFRDITQCKVDQHGTCFVLDQNWAIMQSSIRMIHPNLWTSTLNIYAPVLHSITIRQHEILASDAGGCDIWSIKTPHVLNEYTAGISELPNMKLILHDVSVCVDVSHEGGVGMQTLYSHQALLVHHSSMLSKLFADTPDLQEVHVPHGTKYITCIALLEVMYDPVTCERYTTETLLDVILLADYYQMEIVMRHCTCEVLARLMQSDDDLARALEVCEQHSQMDLYALKEIGEKCSLQAMQRTKAMSSIVSKYPAMCQKTLDMMSDAMEGKLVTSH